MTENLWWQGHAAYWEIPFFAESGLCCLGLLDSYDDMLTAREQLWAIREGLADNPQRNYYLDILPSNA